MPSLLFSILAGWLIIVPAHTPSVNGDDARSPLHDSARVLPATEVAQPGGQPARPPLDRLVYRPRVDVPVAAIATGVWIAAELDKTRLVSTTCHWCDRAANGADTLNDVDSWGRRAFRWRDSGRAIALSNVFGFGLAPLTAFGLDWEAARRDGRAADARADWVLITETIAIASDVTDAMKFSIGRQRPFVHVFAPGAPATTRQSADNNTSFPSGHTTLAFALVTSSGEIGALRGYRSSRWIWRLGLPVATLTAYFRVAADRHYLTDVLAGAGVGSAVGFAVPYLAHRNHADRRIPRVTVAPTARGQMLAATWEW